MSEHEPSLCSECGALVGDYPDARLLSGYTGKERASLKKHLSERPRIFRAIDECMGRERGNLLAADPKIADAIITLAETAKNAGSMVAVGQPGLAAWEVFLGICYGIWALESIAFPHRADVIASYKHIAEAGDEDDDE